MASVFFKRGTKANLPQAPLQDGAIHVTTDERAMYLDTSINGTLTRIRLGDFREYTDFATIAALPATSLDTSALYYAAFENILCKYTGNPNAANGGWVQINAPQTLADLVHDIYSSASAITGGVQVTTQFRDPSDYSALLTGYLKFVSASTDKLAISFTNNNGTPTLTFTPEALVRSFSTSITTDANNAAITNLNFIHTVTGTDASGQSVSTTETDTIPVQGSGINIYESNGVLMFENEGGISTIALAFAQNGGLRADITTTSGDTISSTPITPTIQYGTNTTAVFANGVAVLDVYTKSQVDAAITSQLRAANAMSFKGAVGQGVYGALDDLPTTNVSNGDTYKVAADGTYATNVDAIVGDMFIATGTEDASTGYITGTINWVYIPSGNDDGANGLSLIYNSTSGKIELVDNNGAIAGSIAAGAGLSLASVSGQPTISHSNVTRTNTTGTAKTQQSGSGSDLEFDVVTGITTNEQGHVTGVETTHVTIEDEYNAVSSVAFSSSMSNGDAQV